METTTVLVVTRTDVQLDPHKGDNVIFGPLQATPLSAAAESHKTQPHHHTTATNDRPETASSTATTATTAATATSLSWIPQPTVDRRNSLTPESPYQASDETRARTDLLDLQANHHAASDSAGANGHTHHHRPSNAASSSSRNSIHSPHNANAVNQVVGKASEMIGELAGIVAGVIPRNNLSADDSVRFFVSSPETSRRESLQHGYAEVRRASFTPESPYNVSDETRSRRDSSEADAETFTATETPRSSAGNPSAKYERLE